MWTTRRKSKKQMSLDATAEVLESKEAWTEGLDNKNGAETRDI